MALLQACFAELEKISQDLKSKLRNDFNNIINSMDGLSLSPASHSLSLKPQAQTLSVHNPTFTMAAYSWLLENIANPYPSSAVKESLAQQHGCTLSTVNSWFVNARRRIGWTAVCRDYFNNRRSDAVDAARRALVNEDPNRPLPPDITHAFIRLKADVEGLCSSTLTKSPLADDIDSTVKDVDIASAGGQRHRGLKEVEESSEISELESQDERFVVQHRYSSLECSYSSSPLPSLDESLTDDSEEEDDVFPPILAGRKRHLSCSEAGLAVSTPSTKRTKRLRVSSPVKICHLSPSMSSDKFSADYLHSQKSCSKQILHDSSDAPTSRKQCISDIIPPEIPKDAAPHLALDPLPFFMSESDRIIDEWFSSNFNTLFTLPPPVDVVEPDLSSQWEVELFKGYGIPQEPQKRVPESLKPLAEDQALVSFDSLLLDDLLPTLEDDGYVAPSEIKRSVVTVSDAHSSPDDLSWEPIDWTGLFNRPTCDSPLDFPFTHPYTDTTPARD